MHLLVSVSYSKGGTGDLFQIDAVRDAETGKQMTEGLDVGRHFADGESLAEYLREKLGSTTSWEIEPEVSD